MNDKGNIFTVLLAAVAMVAGMSMVAYNNISGPIRATANVQAIDTAKSMMATALNTTLSNAGAEIGDCDSDGFIETAKWLVPGSSAPTGGGNQTDSIGSQLNDPWGTPFGLCVWDTGPINADTGCGGSGRRLNGSDDPSTGNPETQTLAAIVSAGPNRTFETTCSAYVDSTTDLISTSGDDFVVRKTYAEAEALWATGLTGGGGGASTSKTVFVSSGSYNGNMGGLPGADEICQGLADGAGLTGTYYAWLSDTLSSPDTRFTKATVPYVLPSGLEIASNWSDLTDGTLTNPILEDEDGTTLGYADVWTSTNVSGTSAVGTDSTYACGNWQSNTKLYLGLWGDATQVNSDWTNLWEYRCDYTNAIYCFEQ